MIVLSILKMSISASFFILIFLLFRSIFMQRLPKFIFSILWLVIVFRLLVPFFLPIPQFSSFSVVNEINSLFIDFDDPNSLHDSAFYNIENGSNEIFANHTEPVITDGINSYYELQNNLYFTNNVFVVIWILGFILFCFYFIILAIKCYSYLRTSICAKNKYLDKVVMELSVPENIIFKLSNRISSPLTYGIFKPIIIFPTAFDFSDEKVLRFIVLHELIHIKRYDFLTKILYIVGTVLHWFNPLVWIAFSKAKHDMEISCDEIVISKLGVEEKFSYARALVKLEEKKNVIHQFNSTFSSSITEKRVLTILKSKKSVLVTCIFAILILIISLFSFSVDINRIGFPNKKTASNNEIMEVSYFDYDTQMTYAKGIQSNTIFVSPDRGKSWFNSYFYDASTGLIHTYDSGSKIRRISPDFGESWYSECFVNESEISCLSTETGIMVSSYDSGKTWSIHPEIVKWYSVEEYEEYIKQSLSSFKEDADKGTLHQIELQFNEQLTMLKNNEIKIAKNMPITVSTTPGKPSDSVEFVFVYMGDIIKIGPYKNVDDYDKAINKFIESELSKGNMTEQESFDIKASAQLKQS